MPRGRRRARLHLIDLEEARGAIAWRTRDLPASLQRFPKALVSAARATYNSLVLSYPAEQAEALTLAKLSEG